MPSLTIEARATLLDMLEKDELTDLTVKGSDSETGHRIHAIVLASVSSKFKDELFPGITITFPFPDEVLKAIIGIAYHGKVKEDFLDKWLEEAIDVSLQYKVVELQEAARNHLCRKVTVENMLYIWSLSKRLGNKCESRIVKFVSRNVKVLALEDITNMSKSDFRDLLSNSHLNLRREDAEELFNKWIEVNSISRYLHINLKSLSKTPTKQRFPRDVVLAIGGWDKDAPTGSSELYNPLRGQWTPLRLKLPHGTITYHQLEVIDKNLYMIGGYFKHQGQEGFLDSLHRLDTTKKDKSWDKMASMSVPRCYVSTVTLDGKIFAIGGRTSGDPGRLSSVEMYDPVLDLWTKVSEMTVERSDFAAVVFEDRIYAIGGFDGINYLNSIERYNPKTDTWNIVGHLVTPRQGVTAMVSGNKIYVLGGFDGVERLQSVECFEVKWNGSLQWHHVPNMITCRSNFAACRMENQDIMVIGGLDFSATL